MTDVCNKTELKLVRRTLRRNSPTPENLIWSRLRNRQLSTAKFRRQYSVGKYIIDFYCPEKKLAVEIDGDSHFNQSAIVYDKSRERYIKSLGIKFIRFNNKEIMSNIDGVLQIISNNLTQPLLIKERR